MWSRLPSWIEVWVPLIGRGTFKAFGGVVASQKKCLRKHSLEKSLVVGEFDGDRRIKQLWLLPKNFAVRLK